MIVFLDNTFTNGLPGKGKVRAELYDTVSNSLLSLQQQQQSAIVPSAASGVAVLCHLCAPFFGVETLVWPRRCCLVVQGTETQQPAGDSVRWP